MLFDSLRHGTLILDEIHRLPDLFPEIRGLIDQFREPGRFVLLGSASYDLLKNTAESLAGRIDYIELTPFQFRELPDASVERHWFRGGFPQSYISRGTSVALQDLGNPPLLVVTPGSDEYQLRPNTWVCSARTLPDNLKRLGVGE